MLALRTAVEPETLAAAAREAVRAADRDQPVAAVMTMEQLVSQDVAPRRGPSGSRL